MSNQLPLFDEVDLEEHVFEQVLELSAKYQHRTGAVAWLFNDRLQCKVADEEHDLNSHWMLFGDDLYYTRFRGWYNPDSQVTTIQDRRFEVRHEDQIPERLYRALQSKFGKTVKFLII